MIARHAALARSPAAELGLPGAGPEAVGACYQQWDGRGWPGQLRGDAVPIASRLAMLAEYVEVAHRVGGVDAAVRLARKPVGHTIRASGFTITDLERSELREAPPFVRPLVIGTATTSGPAQTGTATAATRSA